VLSSILELTSIIKGRLKNKINKKQRKQLLKRRDGLLRDTKEYEEKKKKGTKNTPLEY